MQAIPVGAPPSSQPVPTRQSMLRVVSNEQLNAQEMSQSSTDTQAPELDGLAAHIHKRMTEMRNFRNTEGIAQRLLDALRTYKGQYDPAKLADIKKFGGSEVFARVTSTKCRGATALLRDVYLGAERPWDLDPTPVPKVPDDVMKSVDELVKVEVATLVQAGQPVDQQMIADRVTMLRKAAERAAKKQAEEEADRAGSQLDDILVEGHFYDAFAEFLIDLPIFPFAVIKGPSVRNEPQIKWVNGQIQTQQVPKMFWSRVSPFDLYWSPGAANVWQAEFIERIRLTRSDLLAVRGLPGYNDDAINHVLEHYTNQGYRDWWDVTDSERARLEDREQWPRMAATSLIDTAEYHGSVSGQTLLDWGMDPAEITDPIQEYRVQAWMIERWVIKVQINPTPRQRAPYYISNFEKIPGTMVGYGLNDLLDDIQSICNAAARSLVNNLSISSGPQVVINDEVMQPGETDDLYPWKRWHVKYDPTNSAFKPIDFYQPTSNAQELMMVFEKWNLMADDVSAIPRYLTGSDKVGGAGRTASGLAMLMGNAAKTLQNVAASIDRDVLRPMLEMLYDMIMLTMPGMFRGDENIVVKGVNHAVKREQDRMRQLEFLQLTGNPMDMQLMGIEGRANILRSVATNLGLDHERVIPDDEELRAIKQMQMQAAEAGMAEPGMEGSAAPPGQQPAPKEQRAGPEQARKEVEGGASNRATGRPGMRLGG